MSGDSAQHGNEERTVGAGELAEMFGISTAWLRELHRRDIVPRSGRGRYPLERAVRGYVRYLQRRVVADEARASSDPAHRLKAADADLLELNLAQRREQYVRLDDVQEAATAAAAATRVSIDAAIDRMAARIELEPNQEDVRRVLREELGHALRSIRPEFKRERGRQKPGSPGR